MRGLSYRSHEGRLVLNTGGSTGIGLALARGLAREGARVWLLARHQARLETALKSLPSVQGQQHGMLTADVTSWDRVHSAVRRIQEAAGVPDVLINAAGTAHPAYLHDTSLQIFREMMELNYFGTVHMVKAMAPSMIERGSGYIVNFSSGADFLAPFGYAAYAPSKYAVRGLSDSLRLELKPLGLRVSVIFPPDTDTPGFVNENKTKPFETLEAFSSARFGPVAAASASGSAREQKVKARESELADPALYKEFEKWNVLHQEHDGWKRDLERMTSRWESLSAEFEKVKQELGATS